MKQIHQFMSLPLALLAFGCACTKPEHRFTQFQFSDSDLSRYKEIAVKAASAPDVWRKFNAEHTSPKSLSLSATNVEYRIDLVHPALVRLLIANGERTGTHSCYVGVTIRRDTEEVVGIEESFWP
jgi:hypothetical protein